MSDQQRKLADIARQMMSGVVQVHVEGHLEEDIQSVMNPSIRIPGFWSGSGFFVRYQALEGHIVTNAHVVRNAVKVEISSMLTSEERFEAEVVGLAKNLEPDVALIRLRTRSLRASGSTRSRTSSTSRCARGRARPGARRSRRSATPWA
jgi:serine protease Do